MSTDGRSRTPQLKSVVRARSGAVICLLAFAMMIWTYQTGRELGMDASISKASFPRTDYAIATAISKLVYGAPGYLLYTPVIESWKIGSRVTVDAEKGIYTFDYERGIRSMLGLNFAPDCERHVAGTCRNDWGDEIGYTDYMIGAFFLFGFNFKALYNFYFFLLGISVLVFVVHFFRDAGYLVFAPLFLAAHHLASVLLPDEQVTSVIHESRFVPAVACLASLHVAIILIQRDASRLRAVPFVVAQLAIIALAVDIRTSAIWLVAFPVAALVLWLPWRLGVESLVAFCARRIWIVASLVAIPLLLAGYRQLAYDQSYLSTRNANHVVWHSMYMGLSVHPDAERRFGFRYTDSMSFVDAYRYLRRYPELAAGVDRRVLELRIDEALGHNMLKLLGRSRYEAIVRAVYLQFLADHPRYAVESYLLFKPAYLVDQILWHQGILDSWPSWVAIEPAHVPLGRTSLGFFSFPAVAVVVLSFAVALTGGARLPVGQWITLPALLFVASLVPGFVVAPIHYELPVVLVPFGMLVYATGAAMVVLMLRNGSSLRTRIAYRRFGLASGRRAAKGP